MKRVLLLIPIISLSAVASYAQRKAPRFDEYRVVGRFSGKSARVDFRSHSQARMFRTMLSDIAKKGANYRVLRRRILGLWDGVRQNRYC